MPTKFIAATKQFLEKIDTITDQIFELAVSINPNKILPNIQDDTNSQSIIQDPRLIIKKIRFYSSVITELHRTQKSSADINQITVVNYLLDCFKLAASILEISCWREIKKVEAAIAALHSKAVVTAALCEASKQSALQYVENSKSQLDDQSVANKVEIDLQRLAKEIETWIQAYEESFAALAEKIASCYSSDSEKALVDLIQERNALVNLRKSEMRRLVSDVYVFHKSARNAVWCSFDQARADLTAKLIKRVAELQGLKKPIHRKDNNNETNESLRAMQQQVGNLLLDLFPVEVVLCAKQGSPLAALNSLRDILIKLHRPTLVESELLHVSWGQTRLFNEQKREILALQIGQCRQFAEQIDQIFFRRVSECSKVIVQKVQTLRGAYAMRIAESNSQVAVDYALAKLAIKQRQFMYVEGEVFYQIRSKFKTTVEFEKFHAYLENHAKKSTLLPEYLIRIDSASNLQELYQVLQMNFSESGQAGLGLRDNTSHLGSYPRFHRGSSSTTDSLMNNLEEGLTRIVQTFVSSEAANDDDYNHSSQISQNGLK
jgi:hypothetical protein